MLILKSQIPNYKFLPARRRGNLFVIWYLVLGAYLEEVSWSHRVGSFPQVFSSLLA